MKITITVMWGNNKRDITVDTSQKIETTLHVLEDNVAIFPQFDQIKEIRVKKNNKKLSIQNSYAQEGIFSGDVIAIFSNVEKIENDSVEEDDIAPNVLKSDHVISEAYKISDFNISKQSDLQRVVFDCPGFLESSYEEDGEDITFYYSIEEKKTFTNVRKEQLENRYSFLINVKMILDALDIFDAQISEENIYYDVNYIPYLKKRDIYRSDDGMLSEQEKTQIYKAFVAVVLLNKGSLKDYLNGTETISSDKRFAPYKDCKTLTEIREKLISEKEKYVKEQDKTTKRVKKAPYLIKTVLAVFMSVVAITFAVLFLRNAIWVLPDTQACLNGQKAFLRKEYVSCIENLKGIDVKSMDYETKYVLAVSFAKTENLNKEEINSIVEMLSLTTSERELEYWIYLGRGDYAMAEDSAKFVMDDRLLVYAYMKEYDSLDMNTDITGEEKSTRMEELKKMISELGEKYTVSEE